VAAISIVVCRIVPKWALVALLSLACDSRPADERTHVQALTTASGPNPGGKNQASLPPGGERSTGVSPELLARGRYFANAIVDCKACHTRRVEADQTQLLAPEWTGGEIFDRRWNLPGVLVTPNLTPDRETGIGNWSDDELRRAIRQGLNRAGEPLFPLMPAHFYRSMADTDLDALIAFLRALPAQKKSSDTATQLDMPRSALPRVPALSAPVSAPPEGDPVARGKYIVTLANCITCHAPTAKGQPLPDRFLAGGVAFTTPFGSFVTPNITPDPETGIGQHTDAELVRLFREGKRKDGKQLMMNFMPWYIYRNMTDADLADVIAFLRSLPAVKNDVKLAENQFPLGG
jgi:mono/diheme cytochrome c family protein